MTAGGVTSTASEPDDPPCEVLTTWALTVEPGNPMTWTAFAAMSHEVETRPLCSEFWFVNTRPGPPIIIGGPALGEAELRLGPANSQIGRLAINTTVIRFLSLMIVAPFVRVRGLGTSQFR